MDEELNDDFKAIVLAFIKETKDPDAIEIISVSGYGTDWAGGTEGGFYSTFRSTITWMGSDHKLTNKKSQDYEGEDMAALWEWVVKGKRG